MDKVFIQAGRLEAVSFLMLLLIAMPLKYYGGIPTGVRIIGPLHGLLFLAYVAIAMLIAGRDEWHLKKLLLAVVASIVPCGTFWFERRYLRK